MNYKPFTEEELSVMKKYLEERKFPKQYAITSPEGYMTNFMSKIAEHLEMMAAAYLAATDIPIQECELVVRYGTDSVTYGFQRKQRKE